jgi:hypothetical protein
VHGSSKYEHKDYKAFSLFEHEDCSVWYFLQKFGIFSHFLEDDQRPPHQAESRLQNGWRTLRYEQQTTSLTSSYLNPIKIGNNPSPN